MENIFNPKIKYSKKLCFLLLLILNFNCYSQDGSLDLTFNTLTSIQSPSLTGIGSFAFQSSGKVIITGRFTSINGQSLNGIARLNTDGSVDNTFTVGTGFVGNVLALVIQPDDKIILVGQFSSYNGVAKNGIVRLKPDGDLDPTFITGSGLTSNGVNSAQVRIVKLNSLGQIIVQGAFTHYNGTNNNSTKGFSVINSDGSLVAGFDASTSIFGNSVQTIEVQSDNRMLVFFSKSTNFGGLVSQNDFYLKRINTNGALDPAFSLNNTLLCSSNIGGNPTGGEQRVFAIKQLINGQLMVAGDFTTIFGANNKSIARLLSNGAVDTTFNGGGTIIGTNYYGSIYSFDIQLNGKIIIGGRFDSYSGVNIKNIARINSDGSYDSTFNPGLSTSFTSSNPSISQLKILPSTKVFISGSFDSYNTVTRREIARLNGQFPDYPIIANPDSATTVGGTLTTPITNVRANDTYNGAVATSSNTSLTFVSSTNTGVTLNTTGAINVSATVPAGTYTLIYKICATASPTNCVNGTVTITVTAPIVNINAIDDYAYATNGVSSTAVLNVRANDTYNSTQATSVNTTLTFVSSTSTGISLNASGTVTVSSSVPVGMHTLVYKLCSGTTCDIATVNITVYPPSTTLVNGVRANNSVQQIGLQSNGKIIISGGFTSYNNITANYFTRLNSNLTLDTTFLANSAQMPYSPFFLIQPDDKIVLVFRGNVNTYNGMSIPNGIVRLNANGSVDTTFNVGGTGIAINDELTACAMQSDGKILIGGKYLTSYNGQLVKNLIRLNTDGTIDNTFDFAYSYNTNTFACGTISKIVVQPDNKIIVGGNGNYGTNGQPNIVRLDTNGSIDTTFTYGLTGYGPSVYSAICTSCLSGIQDIELLPSGKVIVSGAFSSYNNATTIKNIVRLNSNGTVDTSFNSGTSTDRVIKDVSIDPISGKMYIGGEFTTFNTSSVKKIIRLNSNGSYDSTFNTGTATADTRYSSNPFLYNNIQSTKLQSDGKLLIGGNFTSYNGISATNITRLLPAVVGGQGRSIYENWTSEPEIDDSKSLNIENNTVTLFPNPSNGIFNISLDSYDNQNSSIEVFNILGERIHFSKINSQNSQIDLSNFSSGYYMGIVRNGDSLFKIKLIKQ